MLNVGTYLCNSCAASGISCLGSSKDAVDALWNFCSQELGSSSAWGESSFATLTPYYVFVAGPEVGKDDPGGSHHSKAWTRYGTEFAEYIVEHGLGIIATAGSRLNLKHHAKTTCQVWIWGPDQKALETWYVVERKRRDTLPKPVATPPPSPVRDYPTRAGNWDVARGVADGIYRCPHCNKFYERGEDIWWDADGKYYCREYGEKVGGEVG